MMGDSLTLGIKHGPGHREERRQADAAKLGPAVGKLGKIFQDDVRLCLDTLKCQDLTWGAIDG